MRFSGRALAGIALALAACEPKAPSAGRPSVPAASYADAFQVRFDWAPSVGSVEEAEFRTTMTARSKVRANGKEMPVNVDQAFEFAFAEETLKVDAAAPAEVRRSFSKASLTRAGKKETLGVEGKSLTGQRDPNDVWTWTVEGGARLDEADYASMSEGLGRRGGGRGKDGIVVDQEFGSGRPVKVGDTWHPDVATVAKLYADPGTEIDIAASRLTCKLTSAEKRGNAVHGSIDLDFDFSVTKSGGGILSEPLHFILKGTITGCLDGSSPDASLRATITLKGIRKVTRAGTSQSMDVDFNLVMGLDSRRALRK